jgi:hypothetical protein
MFAYFPSKPTRLANPLMPHVNAALWRFNFITFIARSQSVDGLIAV